MFVGAIQPLADKRRSDGFDAVISTQPVAQAIGALARRPASILLVGDDQPGEQNQPWYVPARRAKLYRWMPNQRERFASDLLWGDLDGDLVPDVPVGRIPARTPQQAARIAAKILAYERRSPRPSDLRLLAWAGSPGYSQAVDALATRFLLSSLRRRAPAWATPWIISADQSSVLCGWPPDQPRLFNEQFRRGGGFAALIGHGAAERFNSMAFGGKPIRYTAETAREALLEGEPGAPLLILACHCGDFALPRDCLAESLLRMPAGPVAVLAATTESHPLTNYFSGTCLLRTLDRKHARLGALFLAVQKQAMKVRSLLMERILKDVEGKLEEEIDVAKLRRDQILMYCLLGDPATRLRLPEPLHGKIRRRPDGGWNWQVHKPKGATALLVGLRPANPEASQAAGALTREQANRAFHAANAAFAFRSLPGRSANEPWQGTVKQPGLLRFVALGKHRLYAAAIVLGPPETQPARTPSAAGTSAPAAGKRPAGSPNR